jgi:Family of unknown function (DUF5723)
MKHFFLFILIFTSTGAFSQEFLGISQSRYAGIQGVYANPAFSTLNMMKREIGGGGYEFAFSNNFMGINGTLLNDLRSLTIYTSSFRDAYTYDNYSASTPGQSNFLLNTSIQGPSFTTRILKGRAGFSIYTRRRSYFNVNNIDNAFFKQIYEGFKYQPLQNVSLEDDHFEFQYMSWKEIAANFSLRVLNLDRHRLVVGITPKLILGGNAIFLKSSDFNYTVLNDSTIRVRSAGLEFSHSSGFALPKIGIGTPFSQLLQDLGQSPGTGYCFDVGAFYEFKTSKNADVYRLRIGASLTDAGSIRYKESIFSRDFYLQDSATISLNDFKSINVGKIDTSFMSNFLSKPPAEYFSMRLPTAFQLTADFRLNRWMYVAGSAFLPFDVPERFGGVKQIRRFTVTPHLEFQQVSIMLPYSSNNYDQANLGLAFRAKGMWIGTNDLLTLFGSDRQQSLSFYIATKFPIGLDRAE